MEDGEGPMPLRRDDDEGDADDEAGEGQNRACNPRHPGEGHVAREP